MRGMLLLAPFAILTLGMLGLALCMWRRIPYAGLVAALSAAGAWLTALSWSFRIPMSLTLSTWSASIRGVAMGLTFDLDGLGWILAMAHLSLSMLVFLTGFSRPGGQRIRVRLAALLLTYAGLAVFLSHDLVTRLFAWTGLDVVVFVVYALLARGATLPPQAVRQLSFNAMASGLVILGALSAPPELRFGQIELLATQTTSAGFFLAAAAFRLGLFPLHVSVPQAAEVRQGLSVQLRLVPALAGLELLGRLTVAGFNPDVRLWVSLLGAAAAWVGAVQVWNSVTARDALPSLVIAFSGLAAIVSQWAGLAAVVTLALALTLGAGLIFLSRGFDAQRRWLTVFSALGLASLVGVPGTPGFLVLIELAGAVRAASGLAWVWLAVFCGAWIVLGAGLWRVLTWPAEPLQGGVLGLSLYVVGAAIAVVSTLVAGVGSQVFSAMTGLTAFELTARDAPDLILAAGLAALVVGLGFALWRAENLVRAFSEGWSRSGPVMILGSLAHFDPPLRAIWWILTAFSRLVGAGVLILESAGGPFWVIAFIVAVALAFRP